MRSGAIWDEQPLMLKRNGTPLSTSKDPPGVEFRSYNIPGIDVVRPRYPLGAFPIFTSLRARLMYSQSRHLIGQQE